MEWSRENGDFICIWNVFDRLCGLVVKSSWPHIQTSGFDSRCYQIFWEVVGLERGPLSLVSTNEELLGRNSSGSGLESREHDPRDPSRWSRGSLYSQTLALSLPTSGGRSVGIVRSRTKATEFTLVFFIWDAFSNCMLCGHVNTCCWCVLRPMRCFVWTLSTSNVWSFSTMLNTAWVCGIGAVLSVGDTFGPSAVHPVVAVLTFLSVGALFAALFAWFLVDV
jgi:hypothetical protein